jgi:hypothetical protein
MQNTLQEENVRNRAYLLWESEGRLPDRDEHYWHLASSQLLAESVAREDASQAQVSEVVKAKRSARTGQVTNKAADKHAGKTADTKKAGLKAAPAAKSEAEVATETIKPARKQPAKKGQRTAASQ